MKKSNQNKEFLGNANNVGHIDVSKTEIMKANCERVRATFTKLEGLADMNHFIYRGSVMSKDGESFTDIKSMFI